jgi:hypothetical protein
MLHKDGTYARVLEVMGRYLEILSAKSSQANASLSMLHKDRTCFFYKHVRSN